MLLAVISFAIIVPYTPIGKFFGFVPPPPAFYLALAGILGAYAVLAEAVKKLFYKRYGQRVEQVLVPKRKTIYSTSRATKFMQDMIAVISLRSEDVFLIESLAEDLKNVLNYPLNSGHMIRNLQHLQSSGLVSINWQARTIKHEAALKDYIKKNVTASEMWATKAADWRRICLIIQKMHGTVNAEYQTYCMQNNENGRLS
jgi:hypothetical protein